MGRRGIGVDQPEKWVFNRLAEAYRSRPGYPDEVVEQLASLGAVEVVDLGAGTGLLALPLAARGLRVTAVEPARAMLAVLEERAREERLPVRAVHAAAEETGLAAHGADLVTLADALQWVDPERAGAEVARILRPGGALAVVEPSLADTPFMREVAAALARANPRARRPARAGALEQLFRLAVGAPPVEVASVAHEIPLDDAALGAVVRSLSFAGPALSEERLARALAELRAAAVRGGGVAWARRIRVFAARRQP